MKLKLVSSLGVILSGIVLAATASAARAQDSCADRVRQDQRELDRAIDRYGYDSAQAQHERAELRRDAASCGYDVDRDGRADRDRYGYGDRGPYGQDRNNPAFDNGYRDGVAMGQRDAAKGKAYGPSKNDQYEDADRGYNKSYGEKKLYKNEYREGFERGYSEGYGRNRYYGPR